MELEKLKDPLPISAIDFRIQSINNGKYATILPYKDARVDINRLNEVCGVLRWKREHTRDNKNCIVSVWDTENKQWVSKEDTGTESNTEAEKGLASDSFKRACFNWGIGIELYNYPFISIKLHDKEVQETGKNKPKYRASYDLDLKNWVWKSEFHQGRIIHLSCIDTNGNNRFKWGVSAELSDVMNEKSVLDFIEKVDKMTKRSEAVDLFNSLPSGLKKSNLILDILNQDKFKEKK